MLLGITRDVVMIQWLTKDGATRLTISTPLVALFTGCVAALPFLL